MPSQQLNQRRPEMRTAFTIVELLAVIGIIALLLGLAFPAISMVREESRSTSCRSSLRQVGLALAAYRTNIGDRVPSCEPIPAVVGEDEVEGGLPEVLDGYVDTDCVCWLCASDDDPESKSTGTSYLYVPGLLRYAPQVQITVGQALVPMITSGEYTPEQLETFRRNFESRELLGLFDHSRGRVLPLLVDSQDRHPNNQSVPRNGLFIDGSVGSLVEELGQLEDG